MARANSHPAERLLTRFVLPNVTVGIASFNLCPRSFVNPVDNLQVERAESVGTVVRTHASLRQSPGLPLDAGDGPFCFT